MALDAPWFELTKFYRRICWLRSGGHGRAAETVKATELAAALSSIRRAPDEPADFEARLRALLLAEEKRIAEAMAFVGSLAPMVANSIRAQAALPSVGGNAQPLPRPRSLAPPDIANFIDTMLSQGQPG